MTTTQCFTSTLTICYADSKRVEHKDFGTPAEAQAAWDTLCDFGIEHGFKASWVTWTAAKPDAAKGYRVNGYIGIPDRTALAAHHVRVTSFLLPDEYIEEQGGDYFVLDRDEDGFDVYVGKFLIEDDAPWLGCITCDQEITRAEAAMCGGCREDFAHREVSA